MGYGLWVFWCCVEFVWGVGVFLVWGVRVGVWLGVLGLGVWDVRVGVDWVLVFMVGWFCGGVIEWVGFFGVLIGVGLFWVLFDVGGVKGDLGVCLVGGVLYGVGRGGFVVWFDYLRDGGGGVDVVGWV
uniref:Uncharacterized protein n=1 Tax=Knipowitschia caucasica TaxID=637954 RepID=A0AAV2MM81_KNICA